MIQAIEVLHTELRKQVLLIDTLKERLNRIKYLSGEQQNIKDVNKQLVDAIAIRESCNKAIKHLHNVSQS